MLHAKALLANGLHRKAADQLAQLDVIPYEGSTEGRRLYREAHLMLAVEAFRKGDAGKALRSIDAARLLARELGAASRIPRTPTSVSRTSCRAGPRPTRLERRVRRAAATGSRTSPGATAGGNLRTRQPRRQTSAWEAEGRKPRRLSARARGRRSPSGAYDGQGGPPPDRRDAAPRRLAGRGR
jgi:hypothetical protein